ncbi:putative nidogen 1-like protein [Leptotrombidium deliense]|uniref:Putative nidogen 1-like protein n=1 Tax=Leptotrombidium deliense TaxID=299467 RepID=A0A443RYD6_9ACAR|nr:putative nidogen 1-like protein [Leptotrombidium deliense]
MCCRSAENPYARQRRDVHEYSTRLRREGNKKTCQEHRERPGAYVPACEDDGTYSKLQCHSSTGMCWCSNPDGKRITEPIRETPICL